MIEKDRCIKLVVPEEYLQAFQNVSSIQAIRAGYAYEFCCELRKLLNIWGLAKADTKQARLFEALVEEHGILSTIKQEGSWRATQMCQHLRVGDNDWLAEYKDYSDVEKNLHELVTSAISRF